MIALFSSSSMALEEDAQSAQAFIKNGQYAKAREIYRTLSGKQPDNLEYRIWVGRTSAFLKEYDEAEKAYSDVLTLRPGNIEALLGMAYVTMWRQQYTRADTFLRRAEQEGPQEPDVLLTRARYLHYQGKEREAARKVDEVLAKKADYQEARDLKAQIEIPQRFEAITGYGYDRFSFATPGNRGYLRAGYISERLRLAGIYEYWSRFGQQVPRGGFDLSAKLNRAWSVRGNALWSRQNTVLAKQEYGVGITRSLPKGWVPSLDYRLLRFELADVSVLSPSVEYYFRQPFWIQGVFYQSWTNFKAPGADTNNQSILLQYFQQLRPTTRLKLGYAYGNESFSDLSIDRLGRFKANTIVSGLEHGFTRSFGVGLNYAFQRRNSGATQHSLGIYLRFRQ